MTYTMKNFFREIFIDPWGRLKDGNLPVRRIVDECGDDSLGSNDEFDQNCNTTEADASNELVKVDTDVIVQKEKNLTNSENISEDAGDVTNDQEALTFRNVEYRDEANRPWWKFLMKRSIAFHGKVPERIIGIHGLMEVLQCKRKS